MKKDILREYFIKWKYDNITDEELHHIYFLIKGMIWVQINRCYCSMINDDIFNEIWLHIQNSLKKWNEFSSNYVSTWLYPVISNRLKYLQYKESMLARKIYFIDDYSYFEKNMINNDYKSAKHECIRDCIENDLNEKEKLVVELLYDPSDDALMFANANKKYYQKQISKSNICYLTDLNDNELMEVKNQIKGKFIYATEENVKLLLS